MRRNLGIYVGAALAAGFAFSVGACRPADTQPPFQSVLIKGLDLPPGANAIVAVQSTAGNSAAAGKFAVAAQTATSVVINSALLVVKNIELNKEGVDEALDETSGDGEFQMELEGPFVINLVGETIQNLGTSGIDDDADNDGIEDSEDADDDNDGQSDANDNDDDNDGLADEQDQVVDNSPVFDAIDLPPGVYNEIAFAISPLGADEAPPGSAMTGLSILVSGTIAGVPFEYCDNFEGRLQIGASTGIVVEDGLLATFLLTFDPVGWFAGIDPSTGTLTEAGVLRICDGQNAVLAEVIRAAIGARARLGSDADGDGDDDADEDGDLQVDDQAADGGIDENAGGEGTENPQSPGS